MEGELGIALTTLYEGRAAPLRVIKVAAAEGYQLRNRALHVHAITPVLPCMHVAMHAVVVYPACGDASRVPPRQLRDVVHAIARGDERVACGRGCGYRQKGVRGGQLRW